MSGATAGQPLASSDSTLDVFNVAKADQDELLRKLTPMQLEIVEVDSSQVGIPLPAAFAPAPPL